MYEIERLQTVVTNEKGLVHVNLIPASQLSLSIHTLDTLERNLPKLHGNLDLQCRQLSHAVATTAIAHAIRDYYVEQFPGLDSYV